MAWFNVALHGHEVPLALPTENIYKIYDGRANSEIGYGLHMICKRCIIESLTYLAYIYFIKQ